MSYDKVKIKIPQIARWRTCGITDTKIASLLNMTIGGLARLLATQEYQEFEAAYLAGQLSEMDRAMAGRVELIYREARAAVPAAMRCLVETVTQKRDLKAALEAAKEILDRDPDRTLVKDKSQGFIADRLPEEVLNSVAEEGNRISQESTKSTKVN